ncbi:MAG: 3-phosphoshikimate 1-carboxyvinyltransferase [Leptospirales bacterium]
MSNNNKTYHRVSGILNFSGDKSLSHRAAILSSIAKGSSAIENFLQAEDTKNTMLAMESMGVQRTGEFTETFKVDSPGLSGYSQNSANIDVGNSGTGARLLLGLFSGLPDTSVTIDGDDSLRKRPMGRIAEPLARFGAHFEPSDKLPIQVMGKKLLPIIHHETLGSAQVKSALMLAAIASNVPLRLEESKPSRDHTENMLEYCGIDILRETLDTGGNIIEMEPPYEVQPREFNIWGDISSASFFIILGLLAKEGEIRVNDVLLNPFRDRFIKILREMGGDLEVIEKETRCGEKGGDIIARPSKLVGIAIDPKDIPGIIDELPILTIAGVFATGEFTFRNAKELRFKESDRIAVMVENLKRCGVAVEEFPDGLKVSGDPSRKLTGEVETFMDHRIVMSFEIANIISRANGETQDLTIKGREWVSTSFPDFFNKLDQVVF